MRVAFFPLNVLNENVFSMLAVPLYTRSRSGVLEECSKILSVTPGNTYLVPKLQVILLLDKQHE